LKKYHLATLHGSAEKQKVGFFLTEHARGFVFKLNMEVLVCGFVSK
jgi:hypothetical protein